jgi:hypothetical protein
MRDDGGRARIVAAVTEKDTTAGAGELIARLGRFAVDEMALSGCALMLMSVAESASMLAGAGRPMYDIAQDVVERRMRFDD